VQVHVEGPSLTDHRGLPGPLAPARHNARTICAPGGMPLEPLLPLFHRLDREWFDGSLAPGGQRLVELRWSDGRMRRTAGMYRFGRHPDGRRLCEIVLSRP